MKIEDVKKDMWLYYNETDVGRQSFSYVLGKQANAIELAHFVVVTQPQFDHVDSVDAHEYVKIKNSTWDSEAYVWEKLKKISTPTYLLQAIFRAKRVTV